MNAGGGNFDLPQSYAKDYPEFDLFLDGELVVGSVKCSDRGCSGGFELPDDVSVGTHIISVEGGSSLELQVWQAEPPDLPPLGWLRIEVPAFAWLPGFSVAAPLGWEFHRLTGIDSYVGEIVGDGMSLTFDYGAFSSSLAYPDDPDYGDYTVTWEPIDEHPAKLVMPKEGKEGITGVYFPRINGPSLNLYTCEPLTPDQRETAFSIFRSIRSMGALLRLNIIFEPEGPPLGWGTPAPYIEMDRIEDGERAMAVRMDVKTEPVEPGVVCPLHTSRYDYWRTPGTYEIDIDHLGDYTGEDLPLTVALEGDEIEVDIHVHAP